MPARLEVPRPDKPARRDRGSRREVTVSGKHGTLVLVGQKVEEEREELGELLAGVLGAGAGVMVLALAGGWFLAWRALRPIARITEAAAEVSASNLSRRVDASRMERELAGLAETLNAAFSRLEQAFERQTRFTADASHELRTPLSIAMSEAELALRKERTPAEYRESLETVFRATQRMKAVVEGLLTLARADARELNLRRERLDLRKLVEETAALVAPLALERRVTVTVAADPVELEGDRDRLREVVTNLLTNAIRYNGAGGKVDVSLQERGDRAVLAVADTGIGIPEKDRPHVFERFYRVDKARSREQGGTGLGLAIAKWAVEAHGGTIAFESREGAGTTFTVSLPLRR
jgi:heavy metal sensor kinase